MKERAKGDKLELLSPFVVHIECKKYIMDHHETALVSSKELQSFILLEIIVKHEADRKSTLWNDACSVRGTHNYSTTTCAGTRPCSLHLRLLWRDAGNELHQVHLSQEPTPM